MTLEKVKEVTIRSKWQKWSYGNEIRIGCYWVHPDRILLAKKMIGVKFDSVKGQGGHIGKTVLALMNFGNITGQKKVKFEHGRGQRGQIDNNYRSLNSQDWVCSFLY